MPKPVSVHEFLDVTAQSGVLSAERLEQIANDVAPVSADASTIADSLVASQTLTQWQANMLLEGRHKGFFLGKYRLLDLLGRGSMGSVYLAEHTLLNRKCAIKVLPYGLVQESKHLERFIREAQAVAALDHPNIVRAYDVDKAMEGERELYFLAMEYVGGVDLQSRVRSTGVLDFVSAADAVRQVAEGLAHAHQAGLIHRDVKPSNLLIDADGVVRILDLGLVVTEGSDEKASLTQDGGETLLGTVDYLSPEQALDCHAVDHRTDLYSLGCTFFFLLTGEPPFNRGTMAMRISAHQTMEAPALDEYRRGVPEKFAAIVRRLMQKNPNDRFENATQVAQELAVWLLDNTDASWQAKHPSVFASSAPSLTADADSVHDRVLPRSDPDATAIGASPFEDEVVASQADAGAGSTKSTRPFDTRNVLRKGLWIGSCLAVAVLFFVFGPWSDQSGSEDSPENGSAKAVRVAQAYIASAEELVESFVKPAEHARIDAMQESFFTGEEITPPFSFVMGETPSQQLLASTTPTLTTETLSDHHVRHTLQFVDAASQLSVKCVAVRYQDYPSLEWTVYLKNVGTGDTPLIEQFRAIDVSLPCPPPSSEMEQVQRWDAASDWSIQSETNSAWRYYHGWVAGWEPFDESDSKSVEGLERWAIGQKEPWIGKNVSRDTIMVEGTAVPPGQLLMKPASGQVKASDEAGSCPGLTWVCPRAGEYSITGRLRNIGAGGNGIEWIIHDQRWKILTDGRLEDQQEQPIEFSGHFSSGQQITLTISDRGDTTGDLTAIDFKVTEVAAVQPGDIVLRYCRGSTDSGSDFEPVSRGLSASKNRLFTSVGGRPTDGEAMPFFNLGMKDYGLVLAVGWPGQWQTEFIRDEQQNMRVLAGQQFTNFRLRPGEEVRSPLIVLQAYESDDWIRGQNVWRRWMLAHNVPRPGGEPVGPSFTGSGSHHYEHMLKATEENQKRLIDEYLENGLPIDYWLMDAGWYVNDGQWENTGRWDADPDRFPDGIRPVSEYAHAKGLKTILWFEPERVTPGTPLITDHPEWLLKSQKRLPHEWQYQANEGWQLFNLANADARKWLTNRIDTILREEGIDVYRQDFNIRPLFYWLGNDEPQRLGITENHYVTGYLAFLDELRWRNPKLLIDSCANGGRRNDLETMRRSVPLWRSDRAFEPVGGQCQTYGLAMWYPYFGTAITSPTKVSPYIYRSNMAPHSSSSFEMSKANIAHFKSLYDEWATVSPGFFGDYFPLTPFSTASDSWLAWQFVSSDGSSSVIQAFRRAASRESRRTLKLRGLRPAASYVVKDFDTLRAQRATGAQLMNEGLTVEISDKPGAGVITVTQQ